MGTARFLVGMTLIIIVWVLWNLPFGPPRPRFDEYPFIFLTLILSLQASYAAPLILLAQNRQEARDRVALDQDREQAAQSRADMDFLAREIAGLRMSVGELATRDYSAPSSERSCARSSPSWKWRDTSRRTTPPSLLRAPRCGPRSNAVGAARDS